MNLGRLTDFAIGVVTLAVTFAHQRDGGLSLMQSYFMNPELRRGEVQNFLNESDFGGVI